MRMYDLIVKKKWGEALSAEEIGFIVEGFTKGEIPVEQMSAWLMAVWFQGMDNEETSSLTMAMLRSGDTVDLSDIPGIKVDKHSTGGVGDKTTLIVAPIAAACGCVVAKMSGRGLGHTGGTLDKLESIPGFRTELSEKKFRENVKKYGLSVIGQSAELAPADKLMYALRDVTGSVDSIPLIASSIMSKKLAAGSDAILLDVTVGSGAFMKMKSEAVELAQTMVDIGESAGRRTVALITNMDAPLGRAVGNSIEVKEAVEVLKGGGPADLREVSLALAADMIYLSEKGGRKACRKMAESVLEDGSAYKKLMEMVEAQGGNISYLEDTSRFPKASVEETLVAEKGCYLGGMDAEKIGIASMQLGAGREKLGDTLDMAAGIYLHKKTGDFVRKGEPYITLYTNDETRLPAAKATLQKAVFWEDEKPECMGEVLARVEKDKTEWYE